MRIAVRGRGGRAAVGVAAAGVAALAVLLVWTGPAGGPALGAGGRPGAARPPASRPALRSTVPPFAARGAVDPAVPCPEPVADVLVCAAPFRAVWRYAAPDVRGFRVQLLYPIGQTLLSYITPAEERSLAFPVAAWPEAEPGDPGCRERRIGIVVVYALHESEQPRVGSAVVHTDCSSPEPQRPITATPDPRSRS